MRRLPKRVLKLGNSTFVHDPADDSLLVIRRDEPEQKPRCRLYPVKRLDRNGKVHTVMVSIPKD